jgi:NADH dehydrogenase
MAIIGKNKAVVDIPSPKLHFNGFFAWLIWLFIHLISLITSQQSANFLQLDDFLLFTRSIA